MIIKLRYSYYTARPLDKYGKTRFRKQDRRSGVMNFDTEVHWDDPDNHWAVVSDLLDELEPREVHSLLVVIIKEEPDNPE